MQPFRVVASKSRSFSALALTDEVETAGCCHPTCKNVGATSVQSCCSVDSCSAVVVPAPGDEVSPEICELSGVALSLLQKLCARRNYTLQDEVLVQFTNSATFMNAANLETAAPTGNATSQMLVSVVRALIKEFMRLGWNLVFERRTALWNVLTEEQDKTETLASWVIPMVPVQPYKPAPLPDHFPQRTHTLSVLSTAKLTNDQLPQGFKDFANPESIGIKIEPALGDALSDAAWCKRCGIPFRPNIRRWGH